MKDSILKFEQFKRVHDCSHWDQEIVSFRFKNPISKFPAGVIFHPIPSIGGKEHIPSVQARKKVSKFVGQKASSLVQKIFTCNCINEIIIYPHVIETSFNSTCDSEYIRKFVESNIIKVYEKSEVHYV